MLCVIAGFTVVPGYTRIGSLVRENTQACLHVYVLLGTHTARYRGKKDMGGPVDARNSTAFSSNFCAKTMT